MAAPDTRTARHFQKGAKGMYALAAAEKMAGIPWLLAPMRWYGIQHFRNIERILVQDEAVKVAFLGKLAEIDGNNSGKGHRTRWTAFALNDSNVVYRAHWRPFHLDVTRMKLAQVNTINPKIGLIKGQIELLTVQGEQNLVISGFAWQMRRVYQALHHEIYEAEKLDHAPRSSETE